MRSGGTWGCRAEARVVLVLCVALYVPAAPVCLSCFCASTSVRLALSPCTCGCVGVVLFQRFPEVFVFVFVCVPCAVHKR